MSVPVPDAVQYHEVTWNLGHAKNGTTTLAGARGRVRFEATATAVAYSDATILPAPVETPVIAGVMTPVELLQNEPGIWNWKVAPSVGVQWAPFHVDVEGPVNLASAATMPGAGPVRVVKGDRGAQGASLVSLEQIADDTLRGEIHDPLTGETEVRTYDLPRGPEGPYGGTEVTAPQVADMVATNSTVRAALDKSYRRGYSVTEYGAVGDGVTDDTAAIQRAIDTAPEGSDVYLPEGRYRTTETITVARNVSIQCMGVIRSDHAGVGIRFDGLGMYTRVNAVHRVSIDRPIAHDTESTGVEISSCYSQQFDIRRVLGFHTGLRLTSSLGKGCVYNTINLGIISDNKVGVELTGQRLGTADADMSWQNQNTFIGGRIHWTTRTSREGYVGIRLGGADGVTTLPNGNVFLNPSVEDVGDGQGNFARPFEIHGRWNAIIAPRMEGGLVPYFGPDSMLNTWIGGLYGQTGLMDDRGFQNMFDIAGYGSKRWGSNGGTNQFLAGGNVPAVAVTNTSSDLNDALAWYGVDGVTKYGGVAAAGRLTFKNVSHRYGLDTSPPTTGTARRGDVRWNLWASPGGFVGWVCVTPGTPGVWKGFGVIES